MPRLKLRIGFVISALMITLALVYDGLKALIELISVGLLGWMINPFINILAQLTFWFWFTYLGVSFMKPGKMLGAKLTAMGLPSLIGLLPWIGDLPYWTSGVIISLAAVYAEDLVESVSPKTLQAIGNKFKELKKAKELRKSKKLKRAKA